MARPSKQDGGFLPNLGSARTAFSILILAQVIAVVITIGRNSSVQAGAWQDLLIITAFAQSIAVCGIIALKLIAGVVRRMSVGWGATVAFVAMLLATIAATEAILYALDWFGIGAKHTPGWHLSLLVRNILIAAIISALALRYLIVQHRSQLESESEQSAKLQALQSRIRPHFLFNSMNSIAGLLRSDPERAEKALHDLADVFRVLLADARKLVPITAERDLARQYLDIEKIRLGDRLHVKWLASNVPRAALIPSLTLQPLIENAIYHGIEPRFAGGQVKIELWGEEEALNIMITNPLPEGRSNSHHKGNKIAMDNIRERLRRHFGEKATLQTFEQTGNYHVKIRLPVVRG
jgi:two-component system sensor histidine kinase AlgZ